MSHTVSAVEHDLLAVARATVGILPPRAVVTILARESSEPLAQGVSDGARAALEQTLARGCALAFLRRGGWRHETMTSNGATRRQRAWERGLPPLRFTMFSYELLRHMCIAPMGESVFVSTTRPEGSGDELLLYLACDMLAKLDTSMESLSTVVGRSSLAQLGFVDALSEGSSDPRRVVALLDSPFLTHGLGADLAKQLFRIERVKAHIVEPARLERLSLKLEQRLNLLVDAATKRDRLDTLYFIAEACSQWVDLDGRHPQLDNKATIGARQRARTASAGVLRVAARVADLHAGLRHIGFVDDGHDRAQALLRDWEVHAPALGRAASVARAWGAPVAG